MKIDKNDGMPDIPKDLPQTLWRGVLIKKCQFEIEGKIFLPHTSKSLPNIGWVVAIGEELIGLIEVGQKVLFNLNANLWINHAGVDYLGVHENDVFCKVVKKGEEDVLVPFNKAVLLEPINTERIYSGLIIPETTQAEALYGKIIGLGHAANPRLKLGQTVVFDKHADTKFMFGSKTVSAVYDIDVKFILSDGDFAGTLTIEKERRPDTPLDKLPEKEPEQVLSGKKIYYDKNQS
ncbi:MAG: hypothetical protein IT212_07480 [Bacteroidia bacterium]|nr:hypothetical protein [Bacteroidia bacterium]